MLTSSTHRDIYPGFGDALLIVDVQNDFLPGGSLAVPHGNEIIEALNRGIQVFHSLGRPIYATRDWHPADHRSFEKQGGPWPAHCVAGTRGAAFPETLKLPRDFRLISKAMSPDKDAYSAFDGTDLDGQLRDAGVSRLFVGGLATDYCILSTVREALRLGYQVYLLRDAIRPINVRPDDEQKAWVEMEDAGAIPITTQALAKLDERYRIAHR